MAADTAEKVMTDAHNRILRFHNERDQAATTRRPKNFVLYHYTTTRWLKGHYRERRTLGDFSLLSQ